MSKRIGQNIRAVFGGQWRTVPEMVAITGHFPDTFREQVATNLISGQYLSLKQYRTRHLMIDINSVSKPIQEADARNLPEGATPGSLSGFIAPVDIDRINRIHSINPPKEETNNPFNHLNQHFGA